MAVNIARARNFANPLNKEDLAEQMGYFDPLKKFITNEKLISWHENDTKATVGNIPSKNLFYLLSTLDIGKWHHGVSNPSGKTHRDAVAQSVTPWREWEKQKEQDDVPDIEAIYPLVNQALEIRSYLAHKIFSHGGGSTSWKKDKIWKDYLKGKIRDSLVPVKEYDSGSGKWKITTSKSVTNTPATIEKLLIGKLRQDVFVTKDPYGNPILTGWHELITKRIDDHFETIMKDISGPYTNYDGGSDWFKKPECYSENFVKWQPKNNFNPPDFPGLVYDWKLKIWFKKVDDGTGTSSMNRKGEPISMGGTTLNYIKTKDTIFQ